MIPNDGILAFETIRLKKLFRISSMERKTNDFKCGRQHRETPGNPSIRRRKLVCFGTTLFRAGTVGGVEAEMDWERTGWLMWRSGLGVPCRTCSFPLFYQQSNESKIKGFSLVCWWSSSYVYMQPYSTNLKLGKILNGFHVLTKKNNKYHLKYNYKPEKIRSDQ